MTREIPDDELIRLAQAGIESAFPEIVHRYLRRGMAVALEYLKNRADAEDVMQEVFRRVFSNLDRFDADRPFAPWFYHIVRNECRSAMKGKWRKDSAALSEHVVSGAISPEGEAYRSVLKREIEKALSELPPMQQTCFQLCVVEGFTSGEAAAALGIAEATVRVHVLRAKRALRDLLAAWDAEVIE